MEYDVLLKIAREAQSTARALSPYLNFRTVTLPGSRLEWLWRNTLTYPLRWLGWKLFKRPFQAELYASDVTRIAQALLNAGNALEYVIRGQAPREEEVAHG